MDLILNYNLCFDCQQNLRNNLKWTPCKMIAVSLLDVPKMIVTSLKALHRHYGSAGEVYVVKVNISKTFSKEITIFNNRSCHSFDGVGLHLHQFVIQSSGYRAK